MSLIVITGGKGAAGVTTTATALAAVWPQPAILADCDPFGGDLALRLRRPDGGWLTRDMGIVGLAAAAQLGTNGVDVDEQVQIAAGDLPVLVGVESATHAARIGELWPLIGDALAQVSTDVIADCGRFTPGAASEHLLARADSIAVVTRATPESVAHLRHALTAIVTAQSKTSIRVVVISAADAKARDVEDVRAALAMAALEVPVIGALALDTSAAAALAGEPTRGLDRSALIASARQVAAALYAEAHITLAVVDTNSAPTLVEAR